MKLEVIAKSNQDDEEKLIDNFFKSKWKCCVCSEKFLTKKELIEHLKEEFEDADETVSRVQDQLEDLGVRNPYT